MADLFGASLPGFCQFGGTRERQDLDDFSRNWKLTIWGPAGAPYTLFGHRGGNGGNEGEIGANDPLLLVFLKIFESGRAGNEEGPNIERQRLKSLSCDAESDRGLRMEN